MRFKTAWATWLILISGVLTFAQTANYTATAGKNVNGRVNGDISKYIVSIEELAKMRLDARREIASGWRKVDWTASGISLTVPEEFEFVAHREDRKTANWEARRWQSSLPQPNDLGYKVWISVETYETRGRKTTAALLKAEEEMWNFTDGSDVSDLPPITHLKLNEVDGIITRWHVPRDVRFTWTTFRVYKRKLQKIRIEISGREETITGVREILQSIKIATD